MELSNYLAFATELQKQCKQLITINGSRKLMRKINAEIQFLNKLAERDVRSQTPHLRSSNLGHYGALLHAATHLPDVTHILQPFRGPGQAGSLVVDVVAGRGHDWYKVTARKGQALHLAWTGQGHFGEKDILQQAQDFLAFANWHPLHFKPPRVHFAFYNTVTHPMEQALQTLGITVWGEAKPVTALTQKLLCGHIYADDSDSDSECSIDFQDCQKITHCDMEDVKWDKRNLKEADATPFVSCRRDKHAVNKCEHPTDTRKTNLVSLTCGEIEVMINKYVYPRDKKNQVALDILVGDRKYEAGTCKCVSPSDRECQVMIDIYISSRDSECQVGFGEHILQRNKEMKEGTDKQVSQKNEEGLTENGISLRIRQSYIGFGEHILQRNKEMKEGTDKQVSQKNEEGLTENDISLRIGQSYIESEKLILLMCGQCPAYLDRHKMDRECQVKTDTPNSLMESKNQIEENDYMSHRDRVHLKNKDTFISSRNSNNRLGIKNDIQIVIDISLRENNSQKVINDCSWKIFREADEISVLSFSQKNKMINSASSYLSYNFIGIDETLSHSDVDVHKTVSHNYINKENPMSHCHIIVDDTMSQIEVETCRILSQRDTFDQETTHTVPHSYISTVRFHIAPNLSSMVPKHMCHMGVCTDVSKSNPSVLKDHDCGFLKCSCCHGHNTEFNWPLFVKADASEQDLNCRFPGKGNACLNEDVAYVSITHSDNESTPSFTVLQSHLLSHPPEYCNFHKTKGTVDRVNLDITTLIALVSSLCHGNCNFVFQEKVLSQQATEERAKPVLPSLSKYLQHKELLVCHTAWTGFQSILETLGGPKERERARELEKTITVVNDIMSDKAASLNLKGRIKDRSKVIFGTGDALQAVTVTANVGFIRAAENQGISFAVHLHPARALTEKKEATACPL